MHDYKAAFQFKQRALAIRLNMFGGQHESTAYSYRQLGVTQHEMLDYKAATQSHQRALAVLLKLINDSSSDKPIACPHLGRMDAP